MKRKTGAGEEEAVVRVVVVCLPAGGAAALALALKPEGAVVVCFVRVLRRMAGWRGWVGGW